MSFYVRKPVDQTPVMAVKLDPSTGDIVIGPVTATAGNWLVAAVDGTLTAVDDATFTASYEPVLAPVPAEVPAPVEDPPTEAPA